jgi:hypothetical protein
MSAIVDKLGEKLCSSASEVLLGLLGRSILTATARRWGLGRRRRVTRRCQRPARVVITRVKRLRRRSIVGMRRKPLTKDIADRWQSVGCWISRNVVDMRSVGQVRWLVGDVSGHRSRMLSPSKAVPKRRRLDNSLIGKLLMRRSNDRKARRGLVSSRHAGSFGGEWVVFVRSVSLGRLLVKSGLDDVSLLFSHWHTSL